MTTDIDPYWGKQMTLFGGGYRHIMVEMTMHLTGHGDTVPVGVVARDHESKEWVGALIPTFSIDLRNPREGIETLVKLLQEMQGHMSPF